MPQGGMSSTRAEKEIILTEQTFIKEVTNIKSSHSAQLIEAINFIQIEKY